MIKKKVSVLLMMSALNILSGAFKYPTVKRDESVVDDYFGTKVLDPYRWLENQDSNETKIFISEQNSLTKQYIESNKYRHEIEKDIEKLYEYKNYGLPMRGGSKYYFTENTGHQNQDIIYSIDSIDARDVKLFLDPNTLSKDGTTFILFTYFSKNGKYCAYGINQKGSDWTTIKIKDTNTLKDLPDALIKVKYVWSVVWTDDSNGFFYGQFDEYKGSGQGKDPSITLNQKLFYHRINTNQSEDIKVLALPEHPMRMLTMSPALSENGKYLILTPMEDQKNTILYAKIDTPLKKAPEFITIEGKMEVVFKYVTSDGNYIYLTTNKDAPNSRLIRIDLAHPEESKWKPILAENKTKVMKSVVGINKYNLAVVYMKDGTDSIEIYSLDGKYQKTLDTPIGQIQLFGFASMNQQLQDDTNLFFKVSSFLSSGSIYRYDFIDQKIKIFKESKINGLDVNQFETKEVFVRSKDGTVDIPLFIVHRKGISLDGSNPTLLFGYGSFGMSAQPDYATYGAFFFNNLKGVFAQALVRGGGEYGEGWHESGYRTKKQNSFDDFHSTAEYLIAHKYTQRDRLSAIGYSAGGLLIGATAVQRPDLYGCAIANVGVMDMLRFKMFAIGALLTNEYGDPLKNKTEFEAIYKYSPLHNIPKNGTQFPATLILTGDHDDRLGPHHSYKFAAQLQHQLGSKLSKTPLMLRVDANSGHAAGKPISKWVQEYTDVMSFILNSLKIDYNSRKTIH